MGFRVQAIESFGFDTSEFRDGLRFAMDDVSMTQRLWAGFRVSGFRFGVRLGV